MTSNYRTDDGYTLYLVEYGGLTVWGDGPTVDESDMLFDMNMDGRPVHSDSRPIKGRFILPKSFHVEPIRCANCGTVREVLETLQLNYGPDPYFDICCEVEGIN